MERVPPGRLQPEARSSEHPDTEHRQLCEQDQRWLLGELVDRQASEREHRDTVSFVDGEHPTGISTKDLWVERAASNDLHAVSELIFGSEKLIFTAEHATQRL